MPLVANLFREKAELTSVKNINCITKINEEKIRSAEMEKIVT